MKKNFSLMCVGLFVLIVMFGGCGSKQNNKNKNENVWYCYEICYIGSETIDLKNSNIIYKIEFFPDDNTYTRYYTARETGKTTIYSGTYVLKEGIKYIYSESGEVVGTFIQQSENEADLTSLDFTNLYIEYFQRDEIK